MSWTVRSGKRKRRRSDCNTTSKSSLTNWAGSMRACHKDTQPELHLNAPLPKRRLHTQRCVSDQCVRKHALTIFQNINVFAYFAHEEHSRDIVLRLYGGFLEHHSFSSGNCSQAVFIKNNILPWAEQNHLVCFNYTSSILHTASFTSSCVVLNAFCPCADTGEFPVPALCPEEGSWKLE